MVIFYAGWKVWHPVARKYVSMYGMHLQKSTKANGAFKIVKMPDLVDPARPELEQVGVLFQTDHRVRKTLPGKRTYFLILPSFCLLFCLHCRSRHCCFACDCVAGFLTLQLRADVVMQLTDKQVAKKKEQGFYTWKLSFVLGQTWYAVLPQMFFGNLLNTDVFPGTKLTANVRSVFWRDEDSPSGVRQ